MVHVAESNKPSRKTVIGQDLQHAVGQVLEHNILLVPVAFLAGCHELHFVLPGKQCALDLGLLEIQLQRWQLADFTAKMTACSYGGLQALGLAVLVNVSPLPREIDTHVLVALSVGLRNGCSQHGLKDGIVPEKRVPLP